MAWQDDRFALLNAGFSEADVLAEGDRQRQELIEGGFSDQEINDYFGVKEPDLTPIKDLLTANLNMKAEEYRKLAEEGKQVPEVADSFLEALDAGFQQSSGVMVSKAIQGKRVTPDMLLPEDAETFHRIASQVGTIAGDIPAMVAGTLIGGSAGAAVGSAVPAVGTAAGALVGGGAGGNALPTAMRETLMQYYEKGEIQDFKDFWERTSSVFINTVKDGAIGGISAGVGGKVLQTAGKVAGSATARIASTSSEIATMVTVGKAFEGEAPKDQDFMDAAILVGGLHFSAKTAGKLRQIYAKTGVRPEQVLQDAQTDVTIKQELLTDGQIVVPKAYEGLVEQSPLKPETKAEPAVVEVDPKTPQEKILAQIGEKTPKEKGKLFESGEFYRKWIDRFDPIQKAQDAITNGEKLESAKNPYDLARMASDAQAKALHFLGFKGNPEGGGVIDFKTLQKTGKSFQEIVSPHRQEMDGLTAYLVSKRVVELEGRGINHGMDLEAAKQTIAEGAKFEKAAQDLVEFQNGALKYLKDSGVISDKAFRAMQKANESYIPFKRIIEGETSGKGTAKNPIKKIKGSDAAIQNPFQSMVENLQLYLELAEKNRAKVSLVELAEKHGDSSVITKVKEPLKAIEVKPEEMAKALKDQGIDADPEAFTIFRKMDKELRDNKFEIYRDGKREVYETSPEIAEAFRLLEGNYQAQGLVMTLAKGIATFKRAAISITPDFISRNIFRDTITSRVFSESGSFSIMDLFYAMGDIAGKKEAYYNWLKAGGANGAFLKIEKNYLDSEFFQLEKQTGFTDKAWNVIKSPVEMIAASKKVMEDIGNFAEQATRLAEFKRVTKGVTEGDVLFKGGMASREITIDFQRMGAKMAGWNAMTAFLNASVQGLDRTGRAIKANPTGVLGRAGLAITAPSLLLWYAFKDDERYKELPQWEKDRFWHYITDDWQDEQVPGEGLQLAQSAPHLVREGENGRYQINKGIVLRFPKPGELGVVFGSLPVRILEAFMEENPDAFNGFAKTLGDLSMPNAIPDLIAPIAEQAVNRSFFTKNELVPAHVEKVLPQYRYTEYTTETAKQLGKMIGAVPFIGELGSKEAPLASPAVIENYVNSWSGNLGRYALQLADGALDKAGVYDLPEKPAWQIGEIPFVKAFVSKHPSSTADSIRTFFEEFERNEQVLGTIKSLAKSGQIDEMEMIMTGSVYQDRMTDLSGFADALKAQSKLIRSINADPQMSADEKRQLIDGVYYQMIAIAKEGKKLNRETKELARTLDPKGEQ